jgi:hypothetical protein
MMARTTPSQWQSLGLVEGIATYQLTTWSAFSEFLDTQVFSDEGRAAHRFIWRGQRDASWDLNSSLGRLFERLGYQDDLEARSREHLDDFKYAVRGRRGLNPRDMTENEWWALGQHFGLATPLLDWTHSPYAAAYFAFEEAAAVSEFRVVYGLDRDAVQAMNQQIVGNEVADSRSFILELIEPLSDENPRLVSQGALFTRPPLGFSVEFWVGAVFDKMPNPILLRLEIPAGERTRCLRALQRMNINHLSLFPDLTGASRATNLRTELELLLRGR